MRDRPARTASEPSHKRLGVLISGSGSNLQAIINACAKPDLDAQVVLVISNVANVKGLQRAENADIPAIVIDHHDFSRKAQFEQSITDALKKYAVDLIALAGFMRVLSAEFVAQYPWRIINIHPSLLPNYPGLNTHQRVIDDGGKEHGATVHFVTPALDAGPIIVQARVPVLKSDNVESLAKRVLQVEHRIYPLAIKWICTERLKFNDGEFYLDDKPLSILSK